MTEEPKVYLKTTRWHGERILVRMPVSDAIKMLFDYLELEIHGEHIIKKSDAIAIAKKKIE